MVVFVEQSVTEEVLLLQNSEFLSIKNKLMIFTEKKDDLTDKIDFIICLGGDGTLLYASLLFQVWKLKFLYLFLFIAIINFSFRSGFSVIFFILKCSIMGIFGKKKDLHFWLQICLIEYFLWTFVQSHH